MDETYTIEEVNKMLDGLMELKDHFRRNIPLKDTDCIQILEEILDVMDESCELRGNI